MEHPFTLRDRLAAGFGQADGRFDRLCKIIIDDVPLGDHSADGIQTAEERKRLEEIQWLGIALVGCDADLQIQEVRYVGTAPSMPDFEAITRTKQTVRIEVSRIVFGDELEQNKYFTMIAALAQQYLERSHSAAMDGQFVYRVYDENAGPISRIDAKQCALEMADFIARVLEFMYAIASHQVFQFPYSGIQ